MQLLTIDYLILNLKGSLTQNIHSDLLTSDFTNPFMLTQHEYGTKSMCELYDLLYCDVKIGVLSAVPRSNIIPFDLVQLQFENHLFYTYSLNDLQQIVFCLTEFFNLSFESINRVDIAKDQCQPTINYKNLFDNITTGHLKIKGREKNIQAFYSTTNGVPDFNGFSIGKRSSSRYLRIYNKTKALQVLNDPKTYISQYFDENGLNTCDPVWRFEYQLNNSFFTYLRKTDLVITWQIFNIDTLIQLIILAEKNHFELVYNTGKKETNKEQPYIFNNWHYVKMVYKSFVSYAISKIKKPFEVSINIQKRLIKGLFREYYVNKDPIVFVNLYRVINQYFLKDWFRTKSKFYFSEFRNKEKIINHFNINNFYENLDNYVI
jgi:hypothetical protein